MGGPDFLFYSGLQLVGRGPSTSERAACFTESTDSDGNLSRIILIDKARIYIFVNFPILLLLLMSTFIPLWSENTLCMISVLLSLLRLALWPNVWSPLENVLCAPSRTCTLLLLGGVLCRCLLGAVVLGCFWSLPFPWWSPSQVYSLWKLGYWKLQLLLWIVRFFLQFHQFLFHVFQGSTFRKICL